MGARNLVCPARSATGCGGAGAVDGTGGGCGGRAGPGSVVAGGCTETGCDGAGSVDGTGTGARSIPAGCSILASGGGRTCFWFSRASTVSRAGTGITGG